MSAPTTDDDDDVGDYGGGVPRGGTGIQPSYIAPGPHNIPPQNRAVIGTVQTPGGAPIPRALDVREINRYATSPQTVNFSLTTAQTLVLAQTATSRILLIIRNSEASAGIVYVGFGQIAGDATSAISLAAGAIFFADYVVPQGDIFMAAASTANIVVCYDETPN